MSRDVGEEGEFFRLALDKMSAVLGASRAEKVMSAILDSTGLALTSADELLVFSAELSKYGGFEGAVGGLLGVQAVMRGGRRQKPPLQEV